MFDTLDNPIESSVNSAHAALCEAQLGRRHTAQSILNPLLARLSGHLASVPAHETIVLRWISQQVLAALGDLRAALMPERLNADLHARAVELTDATDRERLIQALPVWRAVVAAHGPQGLQAPAG